MLIQYELPRTSRDYFNTNAAILHIDNYTCYNIIHRPKTVPPPKSVRNAAPRENYRAGCTPSLWNPTKMAEHWGTTCNFDLCWRLDSNSSLRSRPLAVADLQERYREFLIQVHIVQFASEPFAKIVAAASFCFSSVSTIANRYPLWAHSVYASCQLTCRCKCNPIVINSCIFNQWICYIIPNQWIGNIWLNLALWDLTSTLKG